MSKFLRKEWLFEVNGFCKQATGFFFFLKKSNGTFILAFIFSGLIFIAFSLDTIAKCRNYTASCKKSPLLKCHIQYLIIFSSLSFIILYKLKHTHAQTQKCTHLSGSVERHWNDPVSLVLQSGLCFLYTMFIYSHNTIVKIRKNYYLNQKWN